MKIAVYTICKNEVTFLKRWLNSAKEADYILICDTGSTDTTVPYAINLKDQFPQLNINTVKIDPWRFDDARNFSLQSIPYWVDICICLDMDEVLTPGWKEKVLEAYKTGIDRLRYNYVWSWNEDDTPGVTYYADKIHTRFNYRWVNPVHEVLCKDLRLAPEKQMFINDTLIEHYPDHSKSRSDYLPLLALAVKENPLNDRNVHYYARDLMFAGRYQEAITEFERHLALPTALWKSERSASMRYLGDCCWAIGAYSMAIVWFERAIKEAPNEREPYIALAQAYRAQKNWEGVIKMCNLALEIRDRPNTYICQPNAWSNWPDQMLQEAKQQLEETSNV